MYKRPSIVTAILFLAACQAITPAGSPSQAAAESVDTQRPRSQISSGQFSTERAPSTGQTEYCRKICLEKRGGASNLCSWFGPSKDSTKSVADTSEPGFQSFGWRILPLESAYDLASEKGFHYEIVLANSDQVVPVSPATTTELRDRFLLKSTENQIWLTQDRGDSHNPVFTSSARLSLRPHKPPYLWAEGYAYADAGGHEPIGIFRVFRLRDRDGRDKRWCRHSHYDAQQWCRSVLVEFYDANDSRNALNAPIYGINVAKIESPEDCSDSLKETSDGEGDEGPNKPN